LLQFAMDDAIPLAEAKIGKLTKAKPPLSPGALYK